jgi:hypothetical protein
MVAQKLHWLVTERRIYMGRADQFSDPLEGRAPEGELEWWNRQVDGASTENHKKTVASNREFIQRMAKTFRGHYYISCWHMNETENPEMWRAYTSKNDAAAIQTTYSALRGCLPNYVQIGVVRYIDFAKACLPSMNLFEYIMHKDTPYAFEREVRAVAFPPAAGPDVQHFNDSLFESDHDARVRVYAPIIDVRRLIRLVVLHPHASSTYEAQLTELCARYGLPCPVRSRTSR